MSTMLDKAVELAAYAHTGQKDKSGKSYITHPLRVMMAQDPNDEYAQAAAVLHDVVEDTAVTTMALSIAGFPPEVIAAVDCLTRRDGEDYMHYVARATANPIARKVKLADLADNMNMSRLPKITQKDVDRFNKYQDAKRYIEEN